MQLKWYHIGGGGVCETLIHSSNMYLVYAGLECNDEQDIRVHKELSFYGWKGETHTINKETNKIFRWERGFICFAHYHIPLAK